MKRMTLIAATGLLLLASCSKSKDLYDPTPVEPQTPVTPTEEVTSDDINANVQKVFGVAFAQNHDWSTTNSGEVTINANSSIKKVQVLAYRTAYDEDGEEVTNLDVMNEAELNGANSVKLNYQAPIANKGIYVAFISDNDYQLRKVQGNSVSLDSKASTRTPLTQEYDLPNMTLKLSKEAETESFASQRGWISGEKLYAMSDHSALKMSVNDYSTNDKDAFRALVFSYFVNSKKVNNLPLVKNSKLYNETGYPVTTGAGPIIVSPAYKCDGCLKTNDGYGYEIYNSDLYYYYFPEDKINDVAYLMSLPKYKAFEFKDSYIKKEDDIIEKRGAYALVYWGDGPADYNATGLFNFPAGYKIGFMIRAKTTADNKKKQGELYVDGRLNNEVNKYGNFGNNGKSRLGDNGPRGAWLTMNDHQLLCIESGTDTDFNDIILDIEGGVEEIKYVPETSKLVYTFCFEDTEMGDYDLNDVVIKARRLSETQVEYAIVACGAYDELYVRNITSELDNQEIHALFGKQPKTFINTEADAEKLTPYTVTKTVDKSFSILSEANLPYIYDKTTGKTIKMSGKGQDPHGIMIPTDFKYPLEKTCIGGTKDYAYKEFNSWGQNAVTYTDWFMKPENNKVFKK